MTFLQDQLADSLTDAPEKLHSARVLLLAKENDFQSAENELKDEVARLLITGLAGKNAEERAANLRICTDVLRDAVTIAGRERAKARLELERRQDEFSALKALARLCGQDAS